MLVCVSVYFHHGVKKIIAIKENIEKILKDTFFKTGTMQEIFIVSCELSLKNSEYYIYSYFLFIDTLELS